MQRHLHGSSPNPSVWPTRAMCPRCKSQARPIHLKRHQMVWRGGHSGRQAYLHHGLGWGAVACCNDARAQQPTTSGCEPAVPWEALVEASGEISVHAQLAPENYFAADAARVAASLSGTADREANAQADLTRQGLKGS